MKILKAIGAGLTISVCFLYLGCGSIQIANAANGSTIVPLTIETRLLPLAVTNTPYVAVLDATGGTPSYTWAVTSGQLPSGLVLSPSTGVISGTPTVNGNFSVGLTLTDAATPADKKATTTVTISVAPPPMSVASTTTLFATYQVAYSQALTVTGGAPAYTWSVSSGKLPSGLSLASSTGIISGTPSTTGIVSFTVAVHDSERPAQTKSTVVTMNIAPAPLRIAPTASAAATAGSAFSETLQAAGGAPTYRWSIASGNLPAGLALNSSTGTISGIPSSSGAATFTVTVSDSSNPAQVSSALTTIFVAPSALAIAASSLPSVMVGTGYSQALQVSGGIAPYRWSISSGQLAPGLTLSSAGTISGVPTTSGSSSFTATVSDSSNPAQSASTIRAVTVTPTPLHASAPVLPVHPVGTSYSQSFTASGGTAPYTWRLSSGSLPAGLTLTQAGVISGIAQASGAASFTATVSDSSNPGQSASATAGITITPTPLLITSSALAGVTAGSAYSQGLQASGGTAPYQWNITSGKLPAGLSLTQSGGIISGTTTISGTSAFSVTVTDSSVPAQVTSTTTSVTVAPVALSIVATTLAQITAGTAYAQTLQAVGGTAPYVWSISSGQLPLGLSLSNSGAIFGTPISTSSSSFTVAVTDSGTPIQVQSANLTIAAAASQVAPTAPLSIISSVLSAATTGTSYSQTLQASGGSPAYTWSIASGSLPGGLTLSSTTGVITGTPSAGGTFNFTVAVKDTSSPIKTTQAATSIVVAPALTSTGPGTTWFIRPDGGTRYSTNVPNGQCDGLADTAYSGTGANQHCAFNDFRYMWDDDSGVTYLGGTWVIAGGDTIVVRGCSAGPNQVNASNPDCRVGWDGPYSGSKNEWCYYVPGGSYSCYNPPIPAGTAAQPTRILGACAYGTYTCNPVNIYPYQSNLTQIFGGFSALFALNLSATQHVQVEGIELTTHNGVCTTSGYPAYPRSCNTSEPLDDYGQSGILTDNTTSDLTLKDIYIHGFNHAGIQGPIGGPINMTRVFVGFNGFAGWNFDDGHDTPNAPGSSINASYVSMIGNGFYEQYPIVNKQFPAQVGYDTNVGGFGDSWSGQDSPLASMTCDHCVTMYNTKDGFIGPHVQLGYLSITNSTFVGNMGQQVKWATDVNATAIMTNNLVVGNCARLAETIPGAAQNFNSTAGLPGSYLSGYCRAAGDTISLMTQGGSTNTFSGNTVVLANNTGIDYNCGKINSNGSVSNQGTCGNVPIVWMDNAFLGYIDPAMGSGTAPGLWYKQDSTINFTSSYNSEFGIRKGDVCGSNGIICGDPLLQNEPTQSWPGSEAALDVFLPTNVGFKPTSASPLIGAGIAVTGLTNDYYEGVRSTPTIGAVVP